MSNYSRNIGQLTSCIAGDRRYTDILEVSWDYGTRRAVVAVRMVSPVGGMDGPGGCHAPKLYKTWETGENPSAAEVVKLIKSVVGDTRFSFKAYGKPSKNFTWRGTDVKGLNAKLCAAAIKSLYPIGNE